MGSCRSFVPGMTMILTSEPGGQGPLYRLVMKRVSPASLNNAVPAGKARDLRKVFQRRGQTYRQVSPKTLHETMTVSPGASL